QAEGFIFAGDGAFKLRVFHGGEDFLELWSGTKASGDEVIAGDEGIRTNLLRGQSMEFLAGEVVQREIAVAAEAIKAMQLKVLFKSGQAEETFEGGFLLLHHVAKA